MCESGEAGRQLEARLIAERLTPDEQEEYATDQIAKRVLEAEGRLARARKALYDNDQKIKEATLRNKPKMVDHHVRLKAGLEATIGFAERDLERAKKEVAHEADSMCLECLEEAILEVLDNETEPICPSVSCGWSSPARKTTDCISATARLAARPLNWPTAVKSTLRPTKTASSATL